MLSLGNAYIRLRWHVIIGLAQSYNRLFLRSLSTEISIKINSYGSTVDDKCLWVDQILCLIILFPKPRSIHIDFSRLFLSLTAGAGTRCMSLLSSSPNLFSPFSLFYSIHCLSVHSFSQSIDESIAIEKQRKLGREITEEMTPWRDYQFVDFSLTSSHKCPTAGSPSTTRYLQILILCLLLLFFPWIISLFFLSEF